MIREAKISDKSKILKFCKDTFSWGDYIDHVWDFWISEGHLFLFEKQIPIGICHALYSEDQIWIEGIRIDPNFRRRKIASKLVTHAESIGKAKNLSVSYMLIDVENISSLSMATSLNYDVFQTWNFYSLMPKRNSNYDVYFEKSLNRNLYSHYVKSWRWLPIDDDTLFSFYEQNKIIKSSSNNKHSIAILTDSEHFDKTLIVTLFSGEQNTTLQIISFLQNHAKENNYEKIQILSKEHLPLFDSLDHRISFHLMKKSHLNLI
jgi:GNAT superfamily N-acetyltransferase